MNLQTTIISGTAAFSIVLASCGEKPASTSAPAESTDPSSAETAKAYPLEVCVVSGEKLGSMGAPFVLNHKGTEVRFCCDSCLPDFNKDSDKYVAMVKAGKVDKHTNHPGHDH